jgi:3-dehydroquinate synthase
VYVAELARRTGRLDDETAARHTSVLSSVGLPVTLDQVPGDELPFEAVLATMRVDKKSRGSVLRFVVLEGLARPAILADPSEQDLRASYDALGEGSR